MSDFETTSDQWIIDSLKAELDQCLDCCKRVGELEDAFAVLENILDSEAMNLGAVDGYDYNSGVEYGFRRASIHVKEMAEKVLKVAEG